MALQSATESEAVRKRLSRARLFHESQQDLTGRTKVEQAANAAALSRTQQQHLTLYFMPSCSSWLVS